MVNVFVIFIISWLRSQNNFHNWNISNLPVSQPSVSDMESTAPFQAGAFSCPSPLTVSESAPIFGTHNGESGFMTAVHACMAN